MFSFVFFIPVDVGNSNQIVIKGVSNVLGQSSERQPWIPEPKLFYTSPNYNLCVYHLKYMHSRSTMKAIMLDDETICVIKSFREYLPSIFSEILIENLCRRNGVIPCCPQQMQIELWAPSSPYINFLVKLSLISF